MKRARLAPDEVLPTQPRLPPPWPGRSVVLDGTWTHLRDTPARSLDAQPALYVHGLGGSSLNWTDLADLLACRFDGQAIDLPGFGRSDPGRRYTPAEFASRVIRWIEYAARGPVHLVGNSLGGAVSILVAGERPDLVRTLTLISPAMPFLDPRLSVHSRMLPLLFLPRADRLAANRMANIEPVELTRTIIESCFGDPSRFPPERMRQAIEEAALRSSVPWYAVAYLRTLRALVASFVRSYLPGDGSLWRVASRITAPTLVIGGTRDQLVDVRVPAQVARLIGDSRLLLLNGVGHVAQMEEPRMVARAVVAMLDEVANREQSLVKDGGSAQYEQ
jgi:pimeloyl-ACP methyl ester carboxylesterase